MGITPAPTSGHAPARGTVVYLKLYWALLIPRRTLSSRIVVGGQRAGGFLLAEVRSWSLRLSGSPGNKKADVAERSQAFDHVGLLFNKPPGRAEVLFT